MSIPLSQLLLGPPGKPRLRVLLVLVAFMVYALFALIKHVEVVMGFIDPWASAWLSTYTLGGSLVFYVLVRTGWFERVTTGPGLLFIEILHGVIAIVWAYAITGPARGGILAILVLGLAFSMFGLSLRQARVLVLISFLGLVLVMVWKSQTDALRYPWRVEALHLVFSIIVLIGIAALAQRMAALREHLRTQRLALAESLERIRVLATLDELTGLVNRRHMSELIASEQSRIQRSGSGMCLALLDIDHFKQVNDTYGHQAGDMVLKTFAQSVAPGLRGADVLARWGGEEFLLLLPDTSTEEGLKCVERMRARLQDLSFDAVAPGMHITFSGGLVSTAPGESAQAAIERADAAMYRAKQSGRNCTVLGA